MLYLGAFTNIYVSCSAGSKHDVLYKKGSLHDKFWRSQHPPPKKIYAVFFQSLCWKLVMVSGHVF